MTTLVIAFGVQPPTLQQQRYRALVMQMLAAGKSQDAIAEALGVSQTMISMVKEGTKNAGLRTILLAQKRLGLRAAFFDDPDVGDDPPYEEFRGGAGDRRVVLDDEVLTIVQQMIDDLDPEERAEYEEHDVEWGRGLANTSFLSMLGHTPNALEVYRWWVKRRGERSGKLTAPPKTDVELPANRRTLGRRS